MSHNVLRTLQQAGVNDAVHLSFFPMGGFLNPNDKKTIMCLPFGEDRQCRSDKYEACVLRVNCGGVSCDAATQLKLVNFTSCFEGPKVPFASADACAAAAGFDIETIHACYDDTSQKEAAWTMVQDAVQAATNPPIGMSAAFPWIVVDGLVLDIGDNATTFPLLEKLCDAAALKEIEIELCKADGPTLI